MGERRVHGDPVHPRGELGVAAESADGAPRTHEGLLGHVVGEFSIGDHPDGQRIHLVLVVLDQLGERRLVSLCGEAHQLIFFESFDLGLRHGVTPVRLTTAEPVTTSASFAITLSETCAFCPSGATSPANRLNVGGLGGPKSTAEANLDRCDRRRTGCECRCLLSQPREHEQAVDDNPVESLRLGPPRDPSGAG